MFQGENWREVIQLWIIKNRENLRAEILGWDSPSSGLKQAKHTNRKKYTMKKSSICIKMRNSSWETS
ncbi:unnamed protein product [Caretta caretta]